MSAWSATKTIEFGINHLNCDDIDHLSQKFAILRTLSVDVALDKRPVDKNAIVYYAELV